MKLKISLALFLGATTLFADQALITKSKNFGLEPIPSDKKALMKLIDDKADPITDAKVELGKKLKNPVGKSGVNYRLRKIVEIANGG